MKVFLFLSRDVNVNMFLSLKRAKCTVYDRPCVFVLGAFWKGGVDCVVQHRSSTSFESVGQER